MQSQIEQPIGQLTEHEQIAFYRTQWLTAHNRLHGITGAYPDLLKGEWDRYLRDLQKSEVVCKQVA